jgi:hypothetical protein
VSSQESIATHNWLFLSYTLFSTQISPVSVDILSLSRNVLIAKYSFVVILIYLTRLKLEWHIAHAATLVLWPPLQQFDNHLQRHSQLYQFLGEPLLQDTA